MELLIVVILVGIIASLSVWRWRGNSPGYTFAECQYRRMGEKTLRVILAAERSYRNAESSFTNDLGRLPISDVNIRSAEDLPIAYGVAGTTATDFEGVATYTRRPGVQLVLRYDADAADEPRELWDLSRWCP